ncbi:MAG: MFS transporter [Defluviitaleaceae bacterium]|nr:MFS transporter [Defluviitaleaceae bacterium]
MKDGKMKDEKMKLNIKATILLSFGFFGSSLIWQVYSNFVPPLLESRFGFSTFVIGLIMAIDSFLGVIIQPLFGRLSDKTRTRFGRRLPYLFICMPLCAILFILIPYMPSVGSMMAVIIVFTFLMGVWRTPAVSLMPDMTPGPLQSQANGIVNLMGAVGAIIALGGGGLMYGLGGEPLPFLVAGLLLVAAMGVLALFVREPENPYANTKAKDKSVSLKNMEVKERRSFLFLLLAIFFWFAGYNAIDTFFSLYVIHNLGGTAGDAGIMLSLFAVTLVAFSIPAGILGAKYGRKKTIIIGLIGISALFVPMLLIPSRNLTTVLLMVAGICWACVNINSLPMITRISGPLRIGAFIGYYYLFSFGAQIVTPPLLGWIRDMVGYYEILFIYAIVGFAIAIFFMLKVRHGEIDSEHTEPAVAEEATPTS